MTGVFFGDPLRRNVWNLTIWSGLTGLMDWFESPDAHIFKINVPGHGKETIKLEMDEDNVMHIKGEDVKEEGSEQEIIWHVAERGGKGELYRQIELHEKTKFDHIIVQVENGVLTIIVPKDNSPKPSKNHVIKISRKL